MDGSEFGRYGVLRFMRRHEDTVIASYPIDDEELTFGCDPTCSVRLYYPTVSPLHAKIFFQERKAFIEVLGVHGLFIDKCRVFPKSKPTQTTTVPLSNNSELEINKKRFRFEYPPKALRPVLAFTPSASTSKSARKRVLRLSMIQSAQVFTPRPDPDPRVNLRVLQTPIRLNCSPLKYSLKQELQGDQQQDDEENGGTPIRLVEGNRPQVVEEEQDLVILEEVNAPEPPAPSQATQRTPQAGTPHAASGFPLAPSHQPQQFQTPRRRGARPSLHRSVLIRSAQRAAMRFEMEKEQEQEEREVEEHVTPIEERMEVDEEDEGDQDAVIEEFDEEDYENTEPDSKPIFGWRKSLEAFRSSLHALRSPSRSPERDEYMEQDIAEAHEDAEEYTAHDEHEPFDRDDELQGPEDEEGLGDVSHGGEAEPESDQVASTPYQLTPQRPEQHFYFMTPQTHRSNSLADRVRGRQSTGGAAWASLVKARVAADDPVPAVDKSAPRANAESRERRISQLERRAIQERRRSALTQPDEFFGENIPGSRRNSLGSDSPTKAMFNAASPSKIWPSIKEDEEEVETTMLLEKMKEVVEGMQRRRSLQPDAISILNKTEICDEDMVLEEEMPEGDEAAIEDQCPPSTDSHPAVPATPQMSDLRHVFSEKRAAGMPAPYAGVRELFKAEQARNLETPRLDGVREMFFPARQREPSTPIFEGVDEMLVTPPEYPSQEPVEQSDEVGVESAPEVAAPAPTRLPKKASGAPAKILAVRVREGRETPADESQLADNELTPDEPPAKPSKHSANAPKGSIVRRTTRRAEAEAKEETVPAPAKSVNKARKLVTPEPLAQPKPATSRLEPGRRSRATTKSSESTDQEPAESSKPMRKTARGTKTPAPEPEPEPEPAKSIRRGARRGQPADVDVVVPATTATKRRAAKAKADDASDDPLESIDRAEAPEPPRTRRGKGKLAELDDGAQRTTQGRRAPTATAKARATASSAKSARGVLEKEKENTPERVHVKEEDEMQQQQPVAAAAVKGVRTRKATTAAAQKAAHSEPEKGVDTAKARARAPRTRAASGRK